MLCLIRAVTFTQQKAQFSEPNQLPKWLKFIRTKKEQDCVLGLRYNLGAVSEALWIKAERACRTRDNL
jgi:hypothetical protein